MQTQDSNIGHNDFEKKLELSEAWRQLLGIEAGVMSLPVSFGHAGTSGSTQEETPLLTDDPWASLVHAKGIQVVDLRQIHLHTAHLPMNEQDVEHALDIIQEKL